jgi:putative hydrolase of the HAD superfamily
MQNIKNIIFDLGGVFLQIDYYKTEKAFINFGVVNFKELYSQHNATTLFEDLETGKINAEEFYEAFREISKIPLTNNQIEFAWNAMMGNVIIENLKWLQKIKQHYKIFLFSNTNIIHYEALQKILLQQNGPNSFDENFITAYYSHDLKLRKPYIKSYTTILEREDLRAEETLFIDDTPKNIEGAHRAGLQTLLLTNPGKLIELVEKII